MALAASPALDANHTVTMREDTQFDGLSNAPLQALIDVFLPVCGAKVRLGLGKAEWVYASVEMSIARGTCVACDHDDGTYGAVL